MAIASFYSSDTSVHQATGLPSTALSLFLVSLARVLAIRIPSRRLGVTSNKIYDGGYKAFGIDNNLIPFKNVKTGEEVTLQGPGNNVVFEYEDTPRNSTLWHFLLLRKLLVLILSQRTTWLSIISR